MTRLQRSDFNYRPTTLAQALLDAGAVDAIKPVVREPKLAVTKSNGYSQALAAVLP